NGYREIIGNVIARDWQRYYVRRSDRQPASHRKKKAADLLRGRQPANNEKLSLGSRNGFERKHAQFPRECRIPFGRRFDPLARIASDARAFRHGLNRKIALFSSAEAEKIARKQKLDDLTPAIGPGGALSRSAGDHAEPICSRRCFAA